MDELGIEMAKSEVAYSVDEALSIADRLSYPVVLRPVSTLKEQEIPFFGVKEAVFPFNMFSEVDSILGPEMRSTGEVLGLATSSGEAFYKSQERAQSKLPLEGTVLISVNQKDIPEVADIARIFAEDGFHIVATGRTYETIHAAGISAQKVNKLYEGRPHILDLITNGKHSTVTEIHYMKQNNCREVHSLQELHALIQPK